METLGLADALQLGLEWQSQGGAAIVHTVRGAEHTELNASAKLVIGAASQVRGELPSTMEKAAISAARDGLDKKQSRLYSIELTGDGGRVVGIQGGTIDIFVEVLPSIQSLVIAGAGHIAQPLAELGKLLHFSVTIIDDRPQFANPERFPMADDIHVADFELGLQRVRMNRDTFVVLVTRGHVHDFASLRYVLTTEAGYVGMIGSKVRVRTVLDRLKAEGFSNETLERVYAPIGIDIGSHTPQEIAVAIAAEIVDVYRNGNAPHLKIRYSSLG